MDFTDRSSVRAFLKENDIRDLVELNTMMKGLTGVLVEEMLEAERDAHLGYEKYAVKDKQTTKGFGVSAKPPYIQKRAFQEAGTKHPGESGA